MHVLANRVAQGFFFQVRKLRERHRLTELLRDEVPNVVSAS